MAGDCVFCGIVSGELEAETLFETEDFIVIKDRYPQAPTHLLVVTKRHYRNIIDCLEDDPALAGGLLGCAVEAAERFGLSESGFRTIINTNAGGGQSVFHMHMHILAGKRLSEKMV